MSKSQLKEMQSSIEDSLYKLKVSQAQTLQIAQLLSSDDYAEMHGTPRREFVERMSGNHNYMDEDLIEKLWNAVEPIVQRRHKKEDGESEDGNRTQEEMRELTKLAEFGIYSISAMQEARDLGKYRPTVLLNSIFTSAIADFEAFISEVLTACAVYDPVNCLPSKPGISVSEMFNLPIDELRNSAIRSSVVDSMRPGYKKWPEVLGSYGLQGITFQKEISEVFERRHCIIHNHGKAGDEYSRINRLTCVGVDLSVDTSYLQEALDYLMIVALQILGRSLTIKSAADDRSAEQRAVDWGYRMMRAQRYKVALSYFDSLPADRFKHQESLNLWKVNRWLALKNLDQFESVLKDVRQWEVAHLDDSFKLAKLSLLDENEKAYELSSVMLKRNQQFLINWLEWPLLTNVRKYAEQNNIFPDLLASSAGGSERSGQDVEQAAKEHTKAHIGEVGAERATEGASEIPSRTKGFRTPRAVGILRAWRLRNRRGAQVKEPRMSSDEY
ncbi:hypothetical protein [Kocuria rhizophila]|uniref:hypothetical protein n=1 Tax=Kocuria rhizophila TaxID=72000 RepID=UPI00126A659B|nr:hypothetical protein [Kocuria rhizophila]